MIYIAYIVLFLSFINLIRMAVFLIGSDVYDIKKNISKRRERNIHKALYTPLVSVLVPAHNEELTLQRNLDSVLNSSYEKIELIIINDSSTDRTYSIARNFQRRNKQRFVRIKVINVQVRGKARALNAGLRYARGSIFMCLDADSALAPTSLELAVNEFANPKLGCLSANVKIFSGKGLLNFFQRIEYLVCYQMKKTETVTNVQYIVGGIGSMYRTQLVKKMGFYDTDTITEDIDLSMKLISFFKGKYHIGYQPSVVTYTEAVHDIKGLLRQRYRWKYGRYQVFLKHKHLFWSKDKRFGRVLSWVYLPYALLGEIIYFLEPLVVAFIIYLLVQYGDPSILAGSFLVFTFYTVTNIAGATGGYSVRERVRFIAAAPVAYLGMYVLSFVEYYATAKGIINMKKLLREYKSGGGACDWQHVERRGTAIVS